MRKNNLGKFCIDVSQLNDEQKKDLASRIRNSVKEFNNTMGEDSITSPKFSSNAGAAVASDSTTNTPNPLDDYKPRPNFIFNDNYQDEDYDDECPNCNTSLSEHTREEKIACALRRADIRGLIN